MDFVNFWMGHLNACGVDLHYFSNDVEHHRQVYKEKAMPFLRLQSQTPTETEHTIALQQKAIEELKKENQALRIQLKELPELKKRIERTELFMNTFQSIPKATMDAILAKAKEENEKSTYSKKAKERKIDKTKQDSTV